MRITGGELKGHRIQANFASHVRPTTDMVRESLFNKLTHSTGIEGLKILDLFSGSGIVSLEFLSRGAEEVTSVDKDKKNIFALKEIKKNIQKNNWNIVFSDCISYAQKCENRYDIVFADPPYDFPTMRSLPQLFSPLLNIGGMLILEHRPGLSFDIPAETKKYGSTALSIFALNHEH